MSSSQGAASGTGTGQITTGYIYYPATLRDSSDWTRSLKEKIVYTEYSVTPPFTSTPPWLTRGNGFRLTYLFGQFKCNANTISNCTGDAFGGSAAAVPGPLIT
jgi:hypothetical protein